MKNTTPIISAIMFNWLFLISIGVYAQVGIGTDTPDSSAALDITSKKTGLLVPRMTEVQKNGITLAAEAEGLLIYQKDASIGFYYYTAGAWQPLGDKDWTMNSNGTDIYNTNTGNVGIGTITPTKKLHIEDISNPPLRIVDGGQATNKVLMSDATGNASWQTMTSDNIPDVSNILAFQGMEIPPCGLNSVGSTGNFTIPINGVSTTVAWTVLERQTTQATTVGNNLLVPLLSERLRIQYDFNPHLPFTPGGMILAANNKQGSITTFTINYRQKSESSITLNIVRVDGFGYPSTTQGPCWGGQFYFDVMMTE